MNSMFVCSCALRSRAPGWSRAVAVWLKMPPADDNHDSDGALADMLQLVRVACPPERYKRRGELLCGHMRAVKAARGSRGSQQVAAHVEERIERMNADYAVRAESTGARNGPSVSRAKVAGDIGCPLRSSAAAGACGPGRGVCATHASVVPPSSLRRPSRHRWLPLPGASQASIGQAMPTCKTSEMRLPASM